VPTPTPSFSGDVAEPDVAAIPVALAEPAGLLDAAVDRQAALAEVLERLAELLNDAVLAEPLDDVGAEGARGRPPPSAKGGGGAVVWPT